MLYLVVWLALQNQSVQKYTVDKATQYIEKKTGVDVEIEHVYIQFFKTIDLGTVCVAASDDLHFDIGSLSVKINQFDLFKKELSIEELRLDDVHLFNVKQQYFDNSDTEIQDSLQIDDTQKQINQWLLDCERIISNRVSIEIQKPNEKTSVIGWEHLDISIDDLDIYDKNAALSSLSINGFFFEQEIFDYPESEGGPIEPFSFSDIGWNITSDDISITESSVSKLNYTVISSESSPQFNMNNLNLKEVEIIGSNVVLQQDSLSLQVEKAAFKDHSKFTVSHLSTKFLGCDRGLFFDELNLQTPFSKVSDNVHLKFNNFNDLANFNEKVNLKINLNRSSLGFQDIIYFIKPKAQKKLSDLLSLNESIHLSGNISGRVTRLRAKNVSFQLGDKTKFEGEVSLSGLPDIENTFIDLDVIKLVTQTQDIQKVLVEFEMPESFQNLGVVEFQGHFTGFLSDFVADGTLISPLGIVTSDINLKTREGDSYSGDVVVTDFDIGTLVGAKELGKTDLTLSLVGKGFTVDNINATMKGKIDNLTYLGYQYQNIDVDGKFYKRFFDGSISSLDKNLQLDFDGRIDLNEEIPVFDFDSELHYVDLHQLNLVKYPLVLSGSNEIHLKGKTFEELVGTALFNDLTIKNDIDSVEIANLDFYSGMDGSDRLYKLDGTDIFASLKGKFDFQNVLYNVEEYLNRYYQLNINAKPKSRQDQKLQFSVRIGPSSRVLSFLEPKLSMLSEINLVGAIDTKKDLIDIGATVGKVEFDNNYFKNGTISILNDEDSLNIYIRVDSTSLNNQLFFNTILEGNMLQDYMTYNINSIPNIDDSDIELSGNIEQVDKGILVNNVDKIDLEVKGLQWSGYMDSLHVELGGDIGLEELFLAHNGQEISINIEGKDLLVYTRDFKLDEFSPLIKNDKFRLKGTMNGTFEIEQFQSEPRILGDFKIDSVEFSKQKLGTVELTAQKKFNQGIIDVSGTISGAEHDLAIRGEFIPGENGAESSISAALRVKRFELGFLESFMGKVIENTTGAATGEIQISGPLSKLEYDGNLYVKEASTLIKLLQTQVFLKEQNIRIDEQFVYFNGMQLQDIEGNIANTRGRLFLNNFKNLEIDLGLKADHFIGMDTKREHSDVFYGYALGKFDVNIYGPLADLNMDIEATPHKGTKIFLPLEDEDIDESDAIFTFKKKGDFIEEENKIEVIETGNVSLDMNLYINQNAEIQLIFDQQTGDIMSGVGSGILNIYYDTQGDFAVLGTYVITKGEYLFTYNEYFVNKYFDVRPGGFVNFSGDPYTAQIDIDAVYTIETNLYPLIEEDDSEETKSKSRTQREVELEMHLTGELSQPQIDFSILIENESSIPDDIRSRLNQIRSVEHDNNDLNRQVFGLLMLNSFVPFDSFGDNALSDGISSTIGEFVTNQLERLLTQTLSQVLKDSEIIVNYDRTEVEDLTRNEVDLIYKLDLFNDRATLQAGGNFDIGNSLEDSGSTDVAIAGDFVFEYKMTDEGNLRVKVFSTADNDVYNGRFNKAGISLYWVKDFDNWSDFLNGIF